MTKHLLSSKPPRKKALAKAVSATIIASANQNELLSFGDSNNALIEDTYGRNSQWINSVGNPISSFYGYIVDKELANEYWDSPWLPINGMSEDVIVKDLNGDGLITDGDKTIIGDPYAEIIWSFTTLSLKECLP